MKIDKLLIIPDKNHIEASLDIAQKYGCGFEYNDFFIPALLDDEAMLRDTISFYRGLDGLPGYCTMHGAFFDVTIFSDDARIREVSDYRVEQSLMTASKLGAKGVVFHTNYTPNFKLDSYCDGWVERNYQYWLKKLNSYPELNIYMENMFDTDWHMLVRLAERLKEQENFGICFDYAHACVFGDENQIGDWVKAVAPYVRHIHINDNDFKADLHQELGTGRIDWELFKTHYNSYFPEASVLVEMRGNDKIVNSLEFLKSL